MSLFQFKQGSKHTLFKAWMLGLLWVFTPPLCADDLPQLGETSSLYLSPKKEYEIGQIVVAQIKNQGLVWDDPLVSEYIRQLQHRLTGKSKADLPEWFILQDRSLNAFALPGGFIGIHSGLIETLQDEDELAAVLAHEWAHVSQHHLARLAEQSGLMNLSTLAGALASIAIATQNPSAGAGAMSATLGGASQSRINFTRENEEEADRIGMQILANTGFDPRAMPDVFLYFQREERYLGHKIPEILSTHPLSASRIADASNRADHYPKKSRAHSLTFLLVKTRLNLLEQTTTKKNPQLATAFLDEIQTENKEAVQTYAKAIAAILEDDQHLACSTLQAAPNAHPYFRLAEAECTAGLGQYQTAQTMLNNVLATTPQYRPAVILKAEFLLQEKQVLPAVTLLQRYLRSAKNDSAVYQLLAKAFNQQKDMPRMHEAEAEYRFHSGDYYGALSQYQMALKLCKNQTIAEKRIQAKIKMTQTKIHQIRAL